MNKIDGIIFDVDGTLWDSTEIVAKAWTEYLNNEAGIPIEITSARLHQLFGQLLPDIARQILPKESPQRQQELIHNCCEAQHRALLKTCAPLYQDLGKALQILSQKYPLFIVSNCQAGYIEVFLQATGFGNYITDHLCPGDTGDAKASNISRIVSAHHLRCPVYVGDTMGDYLACREAQVPFVFASYGFGEVPEPDYTIEKPMDLTVLF